MNTLPKLMLCCLLPALLSCKKDEQGEDVIPYAQVNLQLNLTNIEYHGLNVSPGVVEVAGGVRGIIIAKRGPDQYLAFEKNCPYRPHDSCATVQLAPSRLFLEDPCCKTQFDFDGNVVSGPARRPLLRYSTTLSGGGTLLYISN